MRGATARLVAHDRRSAPIVGAQS